MHLSLAPSKLSPKQECSPERIVTYLTPFGIGPERKQKPKMRGKLRNKCRKYVENETIARNAWKITIQMPKIRGKLRNSCSKCVENYATNAENTWKMKKQMPKIRGKLRNYGIGRTKHLGLDDGCTVCVRTADRPYGDILRRYCCTLFLHRHLGYSGPHSSLFRSGCL